MKRIKLFEAFNNTEKINSANFTLFNWVIKAFIIEHDLKFVILSNVMSWGSNKLFILRKIKADSDGQKFAVNYIQCEVFRRRYFPSEIIFHIDCKPELRKFFVDKNIISTNDVVEYGMVKEVIKKMYEDEKNKTI